MSAVCGARDEPLSSRHHPSEKKGRGRKQNSEEENFFSLKLVCKGSQDPQISWGFYH